jgi:hypothetical protein
LQTSWREPHSHRPSWSLEMLCRYHALNFRYFFAIHYVEIHDCSRYCGDQESAILRNHHFESKHHQAFAFILHLKLSWGLKGTSSLILLIARHA